MSNEGGGGSIALCPGRERTNAGGPSAKHLPPGLGIGDNTAAARDVRARLFRLAPGPARSDTHDSLDVPPTSLHRLVLALHPGRW
eukprot:COSAG03_NODE_178_length_11063_cov_43.316951_9_plen_85_part_00